MIEENYDTEISSLAEIVKKYLNLDSSWNFSKDRFILKNYSIDIYFFHKKKGFFGLKKHVHWFILIDSEQTLLKFDEFWTSSGNEKKITYSPMIFNFSSFLPPLEIKRSFIIKSIILIFPFPILKQKINFLKSLFQVSWKTNELFLSDRRIKFLEFEDELKISLVDIDENTILSQEMILNEIKDFSQNSEYLTHPSVSRPSVLSTEVRNQIGELIKEEFNISPDKIEKVLIKWDEFDSRTPGMLREFIFRNLDDLNKNLDSSIKELKNTLESHSLRIHELEKRSWKNYGRYAALVSIYGAIITLITIFLAFF